MRSGAATSRSCGSALCSGRTERARQESMDTLRATVNNQARTRRARRPGRSGAATPAAASSWAMSSARPASPRVSRRQKLHSASACRSHAVRIELFVQVGRANHLHI